MIWKPTRVYYDFRTQFNSHYLWPSSTKISTFYKKLQLNIKLNGLKKFLKNILAHIMYLFKKTCYIVVMLQAFFVCTHRTIGTKKISQTKIFQGLGL